MFLYMLGPESDGYWAVFVGTDRNWLEASSGGLWCVVLLIPPTPGTDTVSRERSQARRVLAEDTGTACAYRPTLGC